MYAKIEIKIRLRQTRHGRTQCSALPTEETPPDFNFFLNFFGLFEI